MGQEPQETLKVSSEDLPDPSTWGGRNETRQVRTTVLLPEWGLARSCLFFLDSTLSQYPGLRTRCSLCPEHPSLLLFCLVMFIFKFLSPGLGLALQGEGLPSPPHRTGLLAQTNPRVSSLSPPL